MYSLFPSYAVCAFPRNPRNSNIRVCRILQFSTKIQLVTKIQLEFVFNLVLLYTSFNLNFYNHLPGYVLLILFMITFYQIIESNQKNKIPREACLAKVVKNSEFFSVLKCALKIKSTFIPYFYNHIPGQVIHTIKDFGFDQSLILL